MGLDVQLKGWAPLLVDIPVEHDGRVVLLCLLEGDRELGWYHEVDHGFPGPAAALAPRASSRTQPRSRRLEAAPV